MENLIFIAVPASLYLIAALVRWYSIAQRARRWERRYAGVGISELRELRQLRDENRQLKGLVADLTLDKHILQEVLSKKV
jgi:putative transposase